MTPKLVVLAGYTLVVILTTMILTHDISQVCAQATGTGSNPGCDPKVSNVQLTRIGSSAGGTFQISWQAQTSSPCLRIQEFKVELKRIKSGTLVSEKTVAGNVTSTSFPDPGGNTDVHTVFAVVTAKAIPINSTFSGSSNSTN